MEKKKKTPQHINQGQFLLWWILAHIIGTGILAFVYNFFSQPPPSWLDFPEWLNFPFVLLIAGILPGLLFSIPQKWLMKKGFGLDVKWWRRASILAYGIGFAAYYMAITSSSFTVLRDFQVLFIALRFIPLILTQTLILTIPSPIMRQVVQSDEYECSQRL